jgi:hypothetical protein
MSLLVRVMQAWERCAGSHMPQALIHPGRTGMYRVLIYHLIHHSRMHHSRMRPSISRPKFISFWTSASRPISTFSLALSACSAHRPPRLGHERTAGLGFFSIQEKALFYTRYHYIYHYISRCYHCVSLCIIVDITIYHVPRRHMISMISMIHNARHDIP